MAFKRSRVRSPSAPPSARSLVRLLRFMPSVKNATIVIFALYIFLVYDACAAELLQKDFDYKIVKGDYGEIIAGFLLKA